MRNMTANLLLTRTAADLKKNGWTQGRTFEGTEGPGTGAADITGALYRAKYGYTGRVIRAGDVNSSFENAIIKSAARRLVVALGGNPNGNLRAQLTTWNDKFIRTRGDVLRLIRKARKAV